MVAWIDVLMIFPKYLGVKNSAQIFGKPGSSSGFQFNAMGTTKNLGWGFHALFLALHAYGESGFIDTLSSKSVPCKQQLETKLSMFDRFGRWTLVVESGWLLNPGLFMFEPIKEDQLLLYSPTSTEEP